MKVDLHSHSTRSDGSLPPRELVRRAAARGLRMLALTDHDETAGLDEARAEAQLAAILLVPGVEISATWRGRAIHIVGLQVDAGHRALAQGLARLRAMRRERAQRMAAGLEAAGIGGSLAGACAHAANPALLGRVHFARFLVERGHAPDVRAVFRKFLVPGKPGHVEQEWAAMQEAVGWIRASGGLAVMAHPARYGLDDARHNDLLADFADAGGQAVEVVTPCHAPDEVARFSRHAQRCGLYASAGSDFHAPGGRDLGDGPPLPSGCRPVWSLW